MSSRARTQPGLFDLRDERRQASADLPNVCSACSALVSKILSDRIAQIIELSREDQGPEPEAVAEAHCFHLMEVRMILEGKRTCGVYDSYGPPSPSTQQQGEPR